MYNISLNTNTIPHLWKRATIPIPRPNKNHHIGTNYQTILLLSPIHNRKHSGYFLSIHTALHNICHQITKGFNNPRPPQHIVAVLPDMRKAFDSVNIHKLIHKLTLINIPNFIIKFIANHIKRMTNMHSI